MKTLMATLAAVAAVTAAAPVAAQPYRDYDRGDRYEQRGWDRGDRGWTSERVQAAERRIESGVRSGQLSQREARQLNAGVRKFSRLEHRYRIDGLTRWERNDLDLRYRQLIADMRAELYDRDREYGYGYGNRR